MELIVAITAQNRKEVFDHAGKCRNFLIYQLKDNKLVSKNLLELKKEETLHEFFHADQNVEEVKNPLLGVNILLTGGIGSGAIQKLGKFGVAAHIIEEKDPDLAIEKLLNGTLAAKKPAEHAESAGCNCSCGGGHHHH
ncbi:Predicted Fe-Mo cluster-binding protein, NifX family [Lutibacter oricola]|uniref:Predicted Fe-Mo cluster-binding protein, NifX family n=1 Tax=Lutibacter oricola TaxID=762486 RepID=A0A1H2XJZ4_9FLAO|nr:NifB/NifX family molybdenum-iron cluster-binding protein [Lutibacter oricola]SDW93028.1 Predicted Fe-Mo cluster-binding protein, NifX family [Lutibacter oricola]